MTRAGRAILLILAGLWSEQAAAQAIEPKCAAPPEIYALSNPLPVSSARIIEGKPLIVVAIGSSTTQGAGVDDPAGSYPARLEMELLRRLPGLAVEVINQGVSGQLARQMVDRFEADVIEHKPALVIWQTGLNDVVAGIDVDDFRQTLRLGIETLKAAGIDVVLMDLQYYPNSTQFEDYDDYLQAMQAEAEEGGISVFHRFATMKHLLKNLRQRSDGIMSSKLFAIMDLNYRCIPVLLADSIFDKLHKALFATDSKAPPTQKK